MYWQCNACTERVLPPVAPAGRWENGRPVWMQPLAAAQAEAKTAGGGEKADLVAKALAAAGAARKAAEQGAALYKDHWQPEGQLQVDLLSCCAHGPTAPCPLMQPAVLQATGCQPLMAHIPS
jgi:hypothetical protein